MRRRPLLRLRPFLSVLISVSIPLTGPGTAAASAVVVGAPAGLPAPGGAAGTAASAGFGGGAAAPAFGTLARASLTGGLSLFGASGVSPAARAVPGPVPPVISAAAVRAETPNELLGLQEAANAAAAEGRGDETALWAALAELRTLYSRLAKREGAVFERTGLIWDTGEVSFLLRRHQVLSLRSGLNGPAFSEREAGLHAHALSVVGRPSGPAAPLEAWLDAHLRGGAFGPERRARAAAGLPELKELLGLPAVEDDDLAQRSARAVETARRRSAAAASFLSPRKRNPPSGPRPTAPREREILDEIDRTRGRISETTARLGATRRIIGRMPEKNAPSEIGANLRDTLAREVDDLRRERDRLYLLSKLAQKAALGGSEEDAAELESLNGLLGFYGGMLGRPETAGAGYVDSAEFDEASLADLRKKVEGLLSGRAGTAVGGGASPAPLAGTPAEKDIRERVARIEDLKRRAAAELAERDAASGLLAIADRLRGDALRRRRGGREKDEFLKNFARLAMVMDLSYSLNVINSAETAIAGMKKLLSEKLASVEDQRRRSRENGDGARENLKRVPEWEEAVRKKLADDRKNVDLFTDLGEQAGKLVDRLDAYRRDVPALLEMIDARDKGKSADALAEYRRRLALLPVLRQYRISGYPEDDGSVSKLSMAHLEEEAARVNGYLEDVAEGEGRFDGVPVEFAGVLIVAVPGIPAAAVANPSAAQIRALLADRRAYWTEQRKEFQDLLDDANAMLDPGNTKRVLDDFGDPIPESLIAYREEERAKADAAKRDADRFARLIDESARVINGAASGSLPVLAGKGLAELREVLPSYADRLHEVSIPDTSEGNLAKIEKIAVARLLPFMGDAVIRWAQADATVEAIKDPVERVLPEARTRFADAVAVIDAVISDIGRDEAFLDAGLPAAQGQALIDRKRALIADTLKPMLQRMKAFIEGTLIPFQRDMIADMDPSSSEEGYATLFKEKTDLYRAIDESYAETLPWSLASQGAAEGDAAGANANIAGQRADFQEYRQLVVDFEDEIRRRKDPNNPEMEDVYGEAMPFSLVKRIRVLTADTVVLAGDWNRLAAEINAILGEIDALTGGAHALAGKYAFPVDITAPDAGSAARLNAIVDSRAIQNLAELLKKIGDDALAAAGENGIGIGGGDGGVPVGTQPPVDISGEQKTAVLALDAVKRLIPSSHASGGNSLTEIVAGYLFKDGVVKASRESLETQIPIFEAFLAKGSRVLDEVFADLDADQAHVGGRPETAAALFARKIRTFGAVRDVAAEGAGVFNQKLGWDQDSFETVADIQGYYESLEEIYDRSDEALDAEVSAAKEYLKSLDGTAKELAEQKQTVTGWLKQLNDPHESALRRIADNLSSLQERTRSVLETNAKAHRARDAFDGAAGVLKDTLKAMEKERGALKGALGEIDIDDLSPELAARIDELELGGSAWLAAPERGAQSIVIKKSHFAGFLNQLFAGFEPESSARDIVRLREELLRNPMALAQLLPNSKMLELGDDPDGFYLVYNSEFSTPHGLETASRVTMGNVLRLWDNNVSVTGHRFGSPPSAGNAPFGDQGVTVSVESLQGENWVNYLDITFHRFIQDIPGGIAPGDQVNESRMMVFDDFALMLADDRLYFGAAGFADFALADPGGRPHYYGGNLKASVKFTEIMTLNAEQTHLFATDPRRFLQTINLDFTKFDPSLDKEFVVDARGDEKRFRRDKVGVGIDLQKALKTADSFTVDFFVSQIAGTDDINQRSVGATVLKGFEFQIGGTPVRTEVGGTGEIGTEYNSGTLRASFELPKQGIVLSAEGKFLGDAETYFLELKKKFGDNTEAFLSWGSRYVGLNHRLAVGVSSQFTLGQLWRAVVGNTASDLLGGKTLEKFNADLAEFMKRDDAENPLILELYRVYSADVGKSLLSLEIGRLTRELEKLQSAGALLDNTKVRGMIGFVSNPVGTGTADRATGGGFQVGTQTELTMTKSQRALIQKTIVEIYASGLSLQTRLLELTKIWQETVAEVVSARWEREIAVFMAYNAQDETLGREGVAKAVEAEARLNQARLNYNMLTGRGPDAALPFDEANPQDLDYLMIRLGKALSEPERLSELFGRLGPGELPLPESSFNLMDWIPFIERLTFTVGVQLQDLMANQVLGAGVTIRLPIWDPNAAARDKSLVLEGRAIANEMLSAYRAYRLRSEHEAIEAASYDAQVVIMHSQMPQAVQAVADGIRAFRNGLLSQRELWDAFKRWHWIMSNLLDARARAALKDAWSRLDRGQAESGYGGNGRLPWRSEGPAVGPVSGLSEALDGIEALSPDLLAMAERSEAAAQLVETARRRIEKVAVDVNAGLNVTASGVAWIPALGVTGLGIYPIVSVKFKPGELRDLQTTRRESERAMAGLMRTQLAGELDFRFFSTYSAYRTGIEALAIYERDLLPAARRAAASGGAAESLELSRALVTYEALKGQQAALLATMNHLLGRAPGSALDLSVSADAALGELLSRFERGPPSSGARENPLNARLGVLRERVKIARAVETIVDKNLKLQEIRVEPVSLIGRALGRLVAALSGSGDSSPELILLARHRVLEAEQELKNFEGGLAAAKSRLLFELERARRLISDLGRGSGAAARLRIAVLKDRVRQLRAQLAMIGVNDPEAEARSRSGESLPASFDELENRLVAALKSEEPVTGAGEGGGYADGSQSLVPTGTLRYYHSRMSLGKEPIGRGFVEGWVEVRLQSRTTPPEALLALAALQQQRADQIHSAAMARAGSKARMLLTRLRLNGSLLRWLREEAPARGAAGIAGENARLVGRLEDALRRDLAEVSAHLGSGDIGEADFLALLPAEESSGPIEAASEFMRRLREVNLAALRESLFEQGLPDELAAGDGSFQLKANLIAERMSYKGFTPVGAFGLFRGVWVAGGFLETPDPEAIQEALEGILADALRQELRAKDRLKEMALRLHSLMAAVADGAKLLEARQKGLEAARQNLSGLLVRFERGSAGADDVAAAEAETAASWRAFIEQLARLRMDFVRLVVELKALGRPTRGTARPSRDRRSPVDEARRGAVAGLAKYVSERLLDSDFAAALDELFDGKGIVPGELRETIRKTAEDYRILRDAADQVRRHEDIGDAEKLELLTKADLEGRRLKLEAALARIFDGIDARSQTDPAWRALYAFLLKDVSLGGARAGAEAGSRNGLLVEMRDALWASVSAPGAREIFDGLKALRSSLDARRRDLLASYAAESTRPEDFLLKDKALDEYLKALVRFDEMVLRAFSSEALRNSPRAAETLNAIFSLRESAERRRTLLKYGRGILAVEALMAVESSRLDALRFRRAAPSEVQNASRRLAFLKEIRARWLKNPKAVSSVSAVVSADGRVRGWLTPEDLSGLERAKRVVVVNGTRWVLPPEHAGAAPKDAKELELLGAAEIVEGVDAVTDRLEEARSALARRRAAAEVEGALVDSDFVLVGRDGKPEAALDLARLRRLEAEGRVLYFSAKPDPSTGLRRALHPIEARGKDPEGVLAYAMPDGEAPAPGKFESLEALLRSLEGRAFRRLQAGEKGIIALMSEAGERMTAAKRLGWINLKLESYAFALDAGGGVAAVYMTPAELEEARKEAASAKDDEPKKSWSFHKTAAVSLGLDADGLLVKVRIGGAAIPLSFGTEASSWVSGDLLALELDAGGRIVRLFQEEKAFEAAAALWWIEDMSGRVWTQEAYRISPTHRLRRYIDPETKLPVLLGWKILTRRFEEAKDELGAVGRWAYMPWNWPDIALELPRGIVAAPIELITGRDPNQHGYLGRVYMRRRDGGATVRRGVFGKIIHFADIFDILPDPVDRYMDPSQFPDEVVNDGPLLPGEWEHEKDPRTDEKNIHFGTGSLLRWVRYASEDMEDARSRILGAFEGSVRQIFVETVRGRDGVYANPRVEHATGGSAVSAVLRETGSLVGAGGSGRLEADPGHIEVDRVNAEIQVSLGATQYAAQVRRLKEYLERRREAGRELQPSEADLMAEIERLEKSLADAESSRRLAKALSAVGPPLKEAVRRTLTPYLNLSPSLH